MRYLKHIRLMLLLNKIYSLCDKLRVYGYADEVMEIRQILNQICRDINNTQ